MRYVAIDRTVHFFRHFMTKLGRLSERMRTGSAMRPVHPKVPSELRQRFAPVCLQQPGAYQQAIAGQTTCPFGLNAWRILHPPN